MLEEKKDIPEYSLVELKGKKIVMKNKIEYPLENLKLPPSVVKTHLGKGVDIKTVLGENSKNFQLEKKESIKNLNRKINSRFSNIANLSNIRRLGTSLNSVSKILNEYDYSVNDCLLK